MSNLFNTLDASSQWAAMHAAEIEGLQLRIAELEAAVNEYEASNFFYQSAAVQHLERIAELEAQAIADGWNIADTDRRYHETMEENEWLRRELPALRSMAGQDGPRELLAAYAHEAWSGWMKYMFSKTLPEKLYNGEVIPRDLVKRWQRQADTPYADLPESEKEGDRAEADRMLAIMRRVPVGEPIAPDSPDSPDGPGWWAFEGHMYWSPSRELKAIIYVSDIGGGELSPSVMMRDKTTHDIVAEEYRSHTVFVGKWTRLHMPWERVPVGEAESEVSDDTDN